MRTRNLWARTYGTGAPPIYSFCLLLSLVALSLTQGRVANVTILEEATLPLVAHIRTDAVRRYMQHIKHLDTRFD